MATPCFYCPQLTADIVDLDEPIITLSESESGHAVRSRRLREGQEVNLLNGGGLIGRGTLFKVSKRSVAVKVDECEQLSQSNKALTIATAIPKGDRQKVMVDMLTQLGVTQIIPLECEHSITRYSDNLGEKWQRAAIEACKQSQNPWLPVIAKGHTVEQLLSLKDHCIVYADAKGESVSSICVKGHQSLVVIIGPEGGLSKIEMSMLSDQGIMQIGLGRYILRTEAAAISAAAQFIDVNVLQ